MTNDRIVAERLGLESPVADAICAAVAAELGPVAGTSTLVRRVRVLPGAGSLSAEQFTAVRAEAIRRGVKFGVALARQYIRREAGLAPRRAACVERASA